MRLPLEGEGEGSALDEYDFLSAVFRGRRLTLHDIPDRFCLLNKINLFLYKPQVGSNGRVPLGLRVPR